MQPCHATRGIAYLHPCPHNGQYKRSCIHFWSPYSSSSRSHIPQSVRAQLYLSFKTARSFMLLSIIGIHGQISCRVLCRQPFWIFRLIDSNWPGGDASASPYGTIDSQSDNIAFGISSSSIFIVSVVSRRMKYRPKFLVMILNYDSAVSPLAAVLNNSGHARKIHGPRLRVLITQKKR